MSDDGPTLSTADRERLVDDARAGLWNDPPRLPARWFYDETGSRLFDRITRLPEYYPTRAETAILAEHAGEIVASAGATTLIELGAGTSTKTRLLLTALVAAAAEPTFVPVDVSVEVLQESAAVIAADFPSLRVTPVVADFTESFGVPPGRPGDRLLAFLGGTVGNFEVPERAAFLDRARAALAPGDHLLLGADLVKDPARLEAAYDDAAGVTAAFNRNLIRVLARELNAPDLSPEQFEHLARWNPALERVEMWLRAVTPVHAHLAAADKTLDLAPGDAVLTEISTKFRLPALREELAAHGFHPVQVWTDRAGDYSLTLAAAG